MPIKVACSCGQNFAAPDKLAGRAVKCPKCRKPLKIPAAAAPQPASAAASGGIEDLLNEAGLAAHAGGGGSQCPSCRAPMPPHGIICTQCGLNIQTGRKMQVADPHANSAKRDAEDLLRKASKQLETSPQEFSASDLGSGANAYIAAAIILVSALAVLALGGGAFYLLETKILTEESGISSGVIAFALGAIFFAIGRIWLLVVAFTDAVWKGLLCLFCDIYFLYYLCTHFSDQKLPVLLCVFGYVAMIAGVVMMQLSGAPAQVPS